MGNWLARKEFTTGSTNVSTNGQALVIGATVDGGLNTDSIQCLRVVCETDSATGSAVIEIVCSEFDELDSGIERAWMREFATVTPGSNGLRAYLDNSAGFYQATTVFNITQRDTVDLMGFKKGNRCWINCVSMSTVTKVRVRVTASARN